VYCRPCKVRAGLLCPASSYKSSLHEGTRARVPQAGACVACLEPCDSEPMPMFKLSAESRLDGDGPSSMSSESNATRLGVRTEKLDESDKFCVSN
jgi:hypothetical protein